MENMSEYISEKLKINSTNAAAKSTWLFGVEGTAVNDKVDCSAITMHNNDRKKYGFISYNTTSDFISVMTFDNIDDLAEAYSCDKETFEPLLDVEVGESITTDDDSTYIRIW